MPCSFSSRFYFACCCFLLWFVCCCFCHPECCYCCCPLLRFQPCCLLLRCFRCCCFEVLFDSCVSQLQVCNGYTSLFVQCHSFEATCKSRQRLTGWPRQDKSTLEIVFAVFAPVCIQCSHRYVSMPVCIHAGCARIFELPQWRSCQFTPQCLRPYSHR